MRSDRLARTLLRLYPRAWRARYGEEFLAFVADAGLSWRAVADVVAAAGAERVRALAALLREEIDGTTPPVIVGSRPFREALAETCLFMALVALTVVALGTAGVPWPIRWWFLILFQGPDRYSPPAGASWSERALVSLRLVRRRNQPDRSRMGHGRRPHAVGRPGTVGAAILLGARGLRGGRPSPRSVLRHPHHGLRQPVGGHARA
jgi:hypothetical protein